MSVPRIADATLAVACWLAGERVSFPAFGAQAARVRRMRCVVCSSRGEIQRWPTEAHHEPPRSRGGRDPDTLPLCTEHHTERHAVGAVSFWLRHGLESEAIVADLQRGREPGPEPWGALPF